MSEPYRKKVLQIKTEVLFEATSLSWVHNGGGGGGEGGGVALRVVGRLFPFQNDLFIVRTEEPRRLFEISKES